MPDYKHLSIILNDLTYHAHWYLDGETVHVVGGYGSKSVDVPHGQSADELSETLLADMVADWWAVVRATVGPGDPLPRNVMATGDEVLLYYWRNGKSDLSRRVVSIEGDQVFALFRHGKQDIGPPRVLLNPEKASEVLGDDTLRTGSWLYDTEVVLDN